MQHQCKSDKPFKAHCLLKSNNGYALRKFKILLRIRRSNILPIVLSQLEHKVI